MGRLGNGIKRSSMKKEVGSPNLRALKQSFGAPAEVIASVFAARRDPSRLKVVISNVKAANGIQEIVDDWMFGVLVLIASSETQSLLSHSQEQLRDQLLGEPLCSSEGQDESVGDALSTPELDELYDEDGFEERLSELADSMKALDAAVDIVRRETRNRNAELAGLFRSSWWPILAYERKAESDRSTYDITLRPIALFLESLFVDEEFCDSFGIGPVPVESKDQIVALCRWVVDITSGRISPEMLALAGAVLGWDGNELPDVDWTRLPNGLFESPAENVRACLAFRHASQLVGHLPLPDEIADEATLDLDEPPNEQALAMAKSFPGFLSAIEEELDEVESKSNRVVAPLDALLSSDAVYLLPDFSEFFESACELIWQYDFGRIEELTEDESTKISTTRCERLLTWFFGPVAFFVAVRSLFNRIAGLAFKYPYMGPLFTSVSHSFSPIVQNLSSRENCASADIVVRLQSVLVEKDVPVGLGRQPVPFRRIHELCDGLVDAGMTRLSSAILRFWFQTMAFVRGNPDLSFVELRSLVSRYASEERRAVFLSIQSYCLQCNGRVAKSLLCIFPELHDHKITLPSIEESLIESFNKATWDLMEESDQEAFLYHERRWSASRGMLEEGDIEHVRGAVQFWLTKLERWLNRLVAGLVDEHITDEGIQEIQSSDPKRGVLRKCLNDRASLNELLLFLLEEKKRCRTESLKDFREQLTSKDFHKTHFSGSLSPYTRRLGLIRNKLMHDTIAPIEALSVRLSLFADGLLPAVLADLNSSKKK